MGDHQAQDSGLEFKFQKAALKHFNHHLQLKKGGRFYQEKKKKRVQKKELLKFAMTETNNSKRKHYPLTL